MAIVFEQANAEIQRCAHWPKGPGLARAMAVFILAVAVFIMKRCNRKI